MGSTVKRIKGWFDELAEVVGWITLATSTTLVAVGRIGGPEYAGLAALAVVTLVGARRYRGVSVGPISVGGGECPPAKPPSAAPAKADEEVVG